MSMKPGDTTLPVASITRSAWPASAGATAAMRSPSTATSARRAGAPLPSTTEPPRSRRDHAIGSGLLDRDRLHLVALLDAVHVLHAGDDLAEDRVVAVEMRRGAVTDVELAAGRVGMLAPGHRHRAAHVLLLVELRLDLIAGAAGAVALGAAALHDEIRDDPVELQPVVEALLGERDEVLDGLRRVLRVELHPDLAALLERDDACLLQGFSLLFAVGAPSQGSGAATFGGSIRGGP